MCDDADTATAIGRAMRNAYEASDMACDIRVTFVDTEGAITVAT
jgi:hypothetical protein